MQSALMDEATEQLDARVHAGLARAVRSLSLVSPALALADWAAHLSLSPGRQMALAGLAQRQAGELAAYARDSSWAALGLPSATLPEPPLRDRRFASPEWQRWPFDVLQQAFVLQEDWWAQATRGVWGVERHHGELMSFWTRQ